MLINPKIVFGAFHDWNFVAHPARKSLSKFNDSIFLHFDNRHSFVTGIFLTPFLAHDGRYEQYAGFMMSEDLPEACDEERNLQPTIRESLDNMEAERFFNSYFLMIQKTVA